MTMIIWMDESGIHNETELPPASYKKIDRWDDFVKLIDNYQSGEFYYQAHAADDSKNIISFEQLDAMIESEASTKHWSTTPLLKQGAC